MMYDLVRLDLSNLDDALVDHLVKVGEPLHVERIPVLPQAGARHLLHAHG